MAPKQPSPPRSRPERAGARAAETPAPAVYSHSRLASFEKCPQQFRYRYVERREVDTESIEAFLGKRVHEVIERLNQFVGRGLVPSLPKVIERFRVFWKERFDAARIRIVRRETPPDAWREIGERCLTHHYRRNYPFDRDESLGIEEPVAFALDDAGRYRVRGIVDRIARAPDGAIEIHDYKTGRWVPTQQSLDEDRQLALYQIGVENRWGFDQPVRLVWHYLLRDQVRVSTRTGAQLDALRDRTIDLIDRIEAETEFPARPSALCDWCEFNDVCPAAARTARPEAGAAPPRAPSAVAERPAPPVAMERTRPRPSQSPSAQLGLFG
jgi:putative RecB family exonuclease